MKPVAIQKFLRHKGNIFLLSFIFGFIVAVVTHFFLSWALVLLVSWDCVALILFSLICFSFYPTDNGQHTKMIILKEGIRYPAIDLLIIVTSAMSLLMVIILLKFSRGNPQEIIFCIFSVFSSWNLIQLLYAVHYTELYYKNDGGVEFNNNDMPNFWDFLYLAYTIGMTYQVSDTNFTATSFRKVALGHALISFIFSTILIATMINFIASLISR
ncbi:DUF1345 domain-containing protein [Leuconostoc gasicomitatum]|uniref:DUF1345 domain-containing protein n=1 Tax=Leuconostoc gasicomitatum TaxID=115778 RepID=A0A9Q3SXQ5_9LACO|nr:DUF1345 domain-containing protein [Leuconostoc gasicomitatum]MBZ5962905.1 DUF1345 domain-containing protein [Leuconostoc gasicomitatum]